MGFIRMKSACFCLVLSSLGCLVAGSSTQIDSPIDDGPFPADLNGSNFTYPWPVKLYKFTSQGLNLEMAFMDITHQDLIAPSPSLSHDRSTSNKPQDYATVPGGGENEHGDGHGPRIALLLHGRNFCGATWEDTVRALLSGGYDRIIIPDQVGFCKSSKPGSQYQFSLHQLALNTKSLLDTLGISPDNSKNHNNSKNNTKLTVIGHSMGGMLATRYSLLYPPTTSRLVLVNPIGLEDYLAEGVPYPSIDTTLQTEQSTTYASIRSYEQITYYPNSTWTPAYDKWAVMLSNIYHGSQASAFIAGQARVVDMVLTQPIIREFGLLLEPKTLLMIGQKDTTAIGKQWSPPEVQEKLGRYDLLGKKAAASIPGSTLVEFDDLGHAPQIQDPTRFHVALVEWLNS